MQAKGIVQKKTDGKKPYNKNGKNTAGFKYKAKPVVNKKGNTKIKVVAKKKAPFNADANKELEKLIMTYNRFKRYAVLLKVFKIVDQAEPNSKVTVDIPTIVTLHRLKVKDGSILAFYLQDLTGKKKYELTGAHYHKDKNAMFVHKAPDGKKYEVNCEVYVAYKKASNPSLKDN